MNKDTYCVQMQEVVKKYPGTIALDGVSLDIRPGTIHGIIGENGAGKSTLMGVLSGSQKPTSGTIIVRGITTAFDHQANAVQAGISLVSQEGSLVPDFSAAENICLGFESVKMGLLVDRSKCTRVASDLLQKWFPRAQIDMDRPVKELSYTDQKVVEILRALHSDPAVLILDEPTASLGATEKEDLWHVMRALSHQGVAVLLISHFLAEILELSHDITALQDGRVVRSLSNEGLVESDLIGMMLNRPGKVWQGDSGKADLRQGSSTAASVLKTTNWHGSAFSVDHFEASAGKVIGLMGLTGAGHFDFARSLFEPTLADGGSFELEGARCDGLSPRQMMDAGVAFVPDHRMTNALIGDWSVRESLSVVDLKKTARRFFGLIKSRDESLNVQRIIKQLAIKVSSPEQKVSSLSGGNKQKVSIGRWLYWSGRPMKLFVFLEPTEGVDIGAKKEIHDLMSSLAAQGAVVVVASSDLMELASVSDAIVPFVKGKSYPALSRSEFSEQRFITAIAGEA
jgi:ribose transport system ATP-binding protein